MPTHYILDKAIIAESPRKAMWDDTSPTHVNHAMLCPKCGEVWGRVVIDWNASWMGLRSFCKAHGDGSFIQPWRQSFEELPPEVLRYELQLRLERFKNDN